MKTVRYLLVVLIFIAMTALTSPAFRPASLWPWIGAAVLLIGLSLLAEWAWEGILSRRLGRAVPRRRFSIARVGIGLALLPLFAISCAVSWFLGGMK